MDRQQHLFESVLPYVVPWLRLPDVVRLSWTSTHVRAMIQGCESFWEHLDFSSNTFPRACSSPFSQFVASSLSDNGTRIRGLSFAFSPDFSDRWIPKLPQTLRRLDLNGCHGVTDTGLLALAERCQHLECFEVYWNVRITDAGVVPVLRANRRTLRRLNISGCKALSDTSLKTLVETCSETLTELDATRLTGVTDLGILLVGEGLKKLSTLLLYANHHLDPVAFSTLGRLKDLEHLDLCGCRIKDRDIERIAEGCPKLRRLNLTWCRHLTDASVRALASHGNGLESLSLHGIERLTPEGLDALSRSPHATSLRELDVRGCPQLDVFVRDGFAELRRRFPYVHLFLLHS